MGDAVDFWVREGGINCKPYQIGSVQLRAVTDVVAIKLQKSNRGEDAVNLSTPAAEN